MSRRLRQAIDDRLSDQTTTTWLHGFAPESPTFPFGVYRQTLSSPSDYSTGGTNRRDMVQMEQSSWLFSILGTDVDAVWDALEDTRYALESIDFVLGGKDTFIKVMKAGDDMGLSEEYTQDGQEVWQGNLTMEFTVERKV